MNFTILGILVNIGIIDNCSTYPFKEYGEVFTV